MEGILVAYHKNLVVHRSGMKTRTAHCIQGLDQDWELDLGVGFISLDCFARTSHLDTCRNQSFPLFDSEVPIGHLICILQEFYHTHVLLCTHQMICTLPEQFGPSIALRLI